VGETAGTVRPRRVITAGGGRRRPEQGEPGALPAGEELPVDTGPVVKEADPEIERLLEEEEELERRMRQHHETPHFRGGDE
jgi:small subunit ribosomal protein S3